MNVIDKALTALCVVLTSSICLAKSNNNSEFICSELKNIVINYTALQCEEMSNSEFCTAIMNENINCALTATGEATYNIEFSTSAMTLRTETSDFTEEKLNELEKKLVTEGASDQDIEWLLELAGKKDETKVQGQINEVNTTALIVKCTNTISNKWICGFGSEHFQPHNLSEHSQQRYHNLRSELLDRAGKLVSTL